MRTGRGQHGQVDVEDEDDGSLMSLRTCGPYTNVGSGHVLELDVGPEENKVCTVHFPPEETTHPVHRLGPGGAASAVSVLVVVIQAVLAVRETVFGTICWYVSCACAGSAFWLISYQENPPLKT